MANETLEAFHESLVFIIKQNLIKFITEESNEIRIRLEWIKSQLLYVSEGQYQFHDKRVFKDISSTSVGYYDIKKAKLKAEKLEEIYLKFNEIIKLLFSDSHGVSEKKDLIYAIYYSTGSGENIQLHRKTVSKIPQDMLKASESNAQLRIRRSKKIIEEWQKELEEDAVSKAIDAHFQQFFNVLQESYNGTLPTPTISYGRISEAFERHLQFQHGINGTNLTEIDAFKADTISRGQAWRLVRASFGNAAWYTGGDVGDVQVKSIMRGARGVTNYNTLQDLTMYFESLLDLSLEEVDEAAEKAFQIFTQQESEIDETLFKEVEKEGYKMTEEILLGRE